MAGENVGGYTLETLEATPPRVTKLLQGIGSLAVVRTQLAQAGLTDADIVEGRDLLLAVLAQPKGATSEVDTEDAKKQRDALIELNDWDEQGFARFGAALKRKSRSAYDYVFDGLSASRTASESVEGVATFLQRLDALEKGTDPARASTKADDAAAVTALAARSLDANERKRLRALVDRALGPTQPLDTLPPEEPQAARIEKLTALREWFDDWSETARVVVKRRADLIRLGLAQRRSKADDDDGSDPGAPPVPPITP